jgi:uncharacterized membrane protein HdeD (DUF308 family)
MKFSSWGVLLLAVFLILYGIFALTNITVVAATIIMGMLAISAGILLLIGR